MRGKYCTIHAAYDKKILLTTFENYEHAWWCVIILYIHSDVAISLQVRFHGEVTAIDSPAELFACSPLPSTDMARQVRSWKRMREVERNLSSPATDHRPDLLQDCRWSPQTMLFDGWLFWECFTNSPAQHLWLIRWAWAFWRNNSYSIPLCWIPPPVVLGNYP